mmetsp:Transcript_7272/g.15874  ORF Transcript_7272/g.15874 Transcript_7272/m.15874 type:complete len:285 (+) Transcript_7272:875-1729(+)
MSALLQRFLKHKHIEYRPPRQLRQKGARGLSRAHACQTNLKTASKCFECLWPGVHGDAPHAPAHTCSCRPVHHCVLRHRQALSPWQPEALAAAATCHALHVRRMPRTRPHTSCIDVHHVQTRCHMAALQPSAAGLLGSGRGLAARFLLHQGPPGNVERLVGVGRHARHARGRVARDGNHRRALPVQHGGHGLGQRDAAEGVLVAGGGHLGPRHVVGVHLVLVAAVGCQVALLLAQERLVVAETVLVQHVAQDPLDGVQEHVPDAAPDPGHDDVAGAADDRGGKG